jgi:antitoxin HicB
MIYYCNIVKDEDKFLVDFPDMPNVLTFGFSHKHALEMAKEALEAILEVEISKGMEIPLPSFSKGYPISVSSHIALSLRLRELRGEQSQTDIAQRLGLSYQAYQRLENPRKANPTIKTLEKIAKVYGRELKIAL